MHNRFDPLQIVCLFCASILLFSFFGCDQPSGPPDREIEPAEIELNYLNLSPLVTKPGEPFTLELLLRGATGSEIHLYTSFGISIGPDGTLTPNEPSGLVQNGIERDFLVLTKDETKTPPSPNEGWFIADDIILPIQENGVETATIWNIMIREPGQISTSNSSRVLLSFRSADPAVIGEPTITELDTDVLATSRVVQIITDNVDDVSLHANSQLTERYYTFFPDDRDFLIIQKPPNVDTSFGGRFSISGEREKGLGDNAYRDPAFFGSSGRLKGAILSLRGIYSLSSTMEEDFCLLTHELLHRWAAQMGEPLAPDGSHWSDDSMTGLNRETSGFGYNESKTCEFNDFELYLAGFISADSVSAPFNQNGYTIDDFISDHGAREPAYPNTQRDFTIGFIIENEEALSDHEIAYFHSIAEEVAKSSSPHAQTWYEATGGRSSISTMLPTPLNNLP